MKNSWLGILLALPLYGCGGETIEVDMGFRGEARSNPLLAAERFSAVMGLPAESFSVYPGLPPAGTLLIAPLESVAFEGPVTEELRSWIASGGQLVLLLTRFQSEWDETKETGRSEVSAQSSAITDREWDWLEWIGVGQSEEDSVEGLFELEDGEQLSLTFEVERVLADYTGESVPPIIGTPDAAHLLSYQKGAGLVHVFSSGSWMQNEKLEEKDNATFLWHLLSTSHADRVWFVYGSRHSLWWLIWDRAWMVVVTALGLLLVWLWRSGARFGPRLADPPPGRRDFGEHVIASGLFLWRQRAADSLLEAARLRFFRRLARVAPELVALEPSQVAQAIAERSKLDAETCRAALTKSASTDPATFTRTVRDLRRMQQSL